MSLSKKEVDSIFIKYGNNIKNVGSSEVQIAIFSLRINKLKKHFSINKKDNHSRRGLISLVNKRKVLLKYFKRKSLDQYKKLILDLGIRDSSSV